jgi:5,10-methylene-tetrahydrofolate dehydrogenase/methenyl tetrahydrofolate cyclohydrolase
MPFNPGLMVQQFLKKIEFPTTTQALLDEARAQNVDPHVHRILDQLPMRDFASKDDLTVTIAQLESRV